MNLPSHEWPRHFTPEQKIALIEKDIAACEKGEQDHIDCPYCGQRTMKGDTLCCMTIGKAVRAILQRQVTGELAETADRIAEVISRN